MQGDKRLLSVLVRQSDSRVQVAFEDTGSGLTEEAQRRCFEQGYTTRPGTRNGTGLWIVKQIMDDSQGTITPENKPQGGARFVLAFPIANIGEKTT